MEVVSGDNWSYKHAKLQSNHHHHQQTDNQLFRCPSCCKNQQCQSTEGKISHSMDLLTSGFPTFVSFAKPLTSSLTPVPQSRKRNHIFPIFPVKVSQSLWYLVKNTASFGFCSSGPFSRDYSRLGEVTHRCYKEELSVIAGSVTSAIQPTVSKQRSSIFSLSLFLWPFSRWTWISLYQYDSILDFIGAKVVVTTGAMRRAKLQSNCHHQQTNTQFLGSTP